MTDDDKQQDDQHPVDAGDGKPRRKGITVNQLEEWARKQESIGRSLKKITAPGYTLGMIQDLPKMMTVGVALKAVGLPSADQLAKLQRSLTMGWVDQIDQMGQVREQFARAMEAQMSLRRRNRDRAVHYITDDHIRDVVNRIDWSTFIAAQRTEHDHGYPAPPDDSLIAQVEAAINDPNRQDVRDGIARELLQLAWVRVAWDVEYDGDDSGTLQLEDPETGEIVDYVATADDVTRLLFDDELAGPPDSEDWKRFPNEYIERDILEALLLALPAAPATIPPAYAPVFRDGIGHALTDGIARTFQCRAVGTWEADEHGWPELRGSWGANGKPMSGEVLFTVDTDYAADKEAAWAIVDQLDDADMDVLDYITGKWFENRNNLGGLEGVHFTTKEMLEAWGTKEHHKGGYLPKQHAAVADSVRKLLHISVTGRAWFVPKTTNGRKGKPEPSDIHVPLLGKSGPRFSDPKYGGRQSSREWVLNPSGWVMVSGNTTPQHGRMLQSVLQLHPINDRNIKRLNRYLRGIFRIRGDGGKQPHVIRTLLEESGIGVNNKKNPKDFRKGIEEALDHLKQIGVVSKWTYLDDVPAQGRGMIDRWLGVRVQIIPGDDAVGKPITKPRRQRRRAVTAR